ncbi:GDP-mannose 4,6-dehydratase [Candidatus Micrarchaeota archaeon]|nr:GDP-mannose 4,6-dehydratase [Candidatus Micrarchaeota archaeon]
MAYKSNYWIDKNVFITGATGFLGSSLTQMLVTNGANVVALVRDGVPKSDFYLSGVYRQVISVHGKLEDLTVIKRSLNEYDIEHIFHLGAQTQVVTANRSPLDTFESNIMGTWNVLEAARLSSLVKGLVVASTDKAYGSQKKLPYDESTPLQGEHPYDVSKSASDLISQSYFKTYGLPVAITRCGNFFGGGDLNFNRIVPGTIKSVLQGKTPVIRSDGKFVRDYLYIEDAAIAYLLLAENVARPQIKGEAFNFSTETPTSVLEVVNTILQQMKSSLKPKITNEATGEIKEQYLSAKKAKSLLNWKPKYSLQAGLTETILWYRSFFKNQNLGKFV